MKKRSKKCKSSAFKECCTEFLMTDKQSFKICLPMLERVWNQSLNANKRPSVVIGIRRNDREIFTITGEITIEEQRKQ